MPNHKDENQVVVCPTMCKKIMFLKAQKSDSMPKHSKSKKIHPINDDNNVERKEITEVQEEVSSNDLDITEIQVINGHQITKKNILHTYYCHNQIKYLINELNHNPVRFLCKKSIPITEISFNIIPILKKYEKEHEYLKKLFLNSDNEKIMEKLINDILFSSMYIFSILSSNIKYTNFEEQILKQSLIPIEVIQLIEKYTKRGGLKNAAKSFMYCYHHAKKYYKLFSLVDQKTNYLKKKHKIKYVHYFVKIYDYMFYVLNSNCNNASCLTDYLQSCANRFLFTVKIKLTDFLNSSWLVCQQSPLFTKETSKNFFRFYQVYSKQLSFINYQKITNLLFLSKKEIQHLYKINTNLPMIKMIYYSIYSLYNYTLSTGCKGAILSHLSYLLYEFLTQPILQDFVHLKTEKQTTTLSQHILKKRFDKEKLQKYINRYERKSIPNILPKPYNTKTYIETKKLPIQVV
ncbi:hypothetical protein AB837_00316 [bacterium AB1]|nr:hypothetical protein AB837_00316 [bacterium AB1]